MAKPTLLTTGPMMALIEDGIGVIDFAAPDAGEIATEQRLEHQHERIAADAFEVLSDHIGADPDRLAQWNSHGKTSADFC